MPPELIDPSLLTIFSSAFDAASFQIGDIGLFQDHDEAKSIINTYFEFEFEFFF